MTNTDTADAIGTAIQVQGAGAWPAPSWCASPSTRPRRPQAVPHIREQLDRMGIDVPLIGDFHYNGHRLLTDYPACAQALSKYRINPGNVGKGDKRDRQFAQMIEVAHAPRQAGAHRRQLGQPRPGTAGRADGRERAARRAVGRQAGDVRGAGAVGAAVGRGCARELGHGPRPDHHQLQGQRRAGPDRASTARWRARCDYALHLGLTEAGMGTKGTVASTAALARAAAGRHRRHDPRVADAAARRGAHAGSGGRAGDPAVARPAQLQAQRHRLPGLRPHHQHRVPGAGQADRRLPARADAGVEGALPGRREHEGGGDGLHRQRPRRKQACRHRHQPAGHRRGAGRAGVHRRREGADAARRQASRRSSSRSSRTTSSAASAPMRPRDGRGQDSRRAPRRIAACRGEGHERHPAGQSRARSACPIRRCGSGSRTRCASCCARYGYQYMRTPIVEPTALFVRGLGEVTDIVEKEMYSFATR